MINEKFDKLTKSVNEILSHVTQNKDKINDMVFSLDRLSSHIKTDTHQLSKPSNGSNMLPKEGEKIPIPLERTRSTELGGYNIPTFNTFDPLSNVNNDVIPQRIPVEVLFLGSSQLKHLKCERIFGFQNKDKIKYVKTPLIEAISFDNDKFQIPTCFVILTGTNDLSNNDDPLEMAYRYRNKVTDLQSRSLRVASWNIDGCFYRISDTRFNKLEDDSVLALLYKADIIFLIETHCNEDDNLAIKNFEIVKNNRKKLVNARKRSGGLAVCIRKEIRSGIKILPFTNFTCYNHMNSPSVIDYILLHEDLLKSVNSFCVELLNPLSIHCMIHVDIKLQYV